MDIQLTQILFQLINFSVVLGALTYLLYKPVLKIFDERARRIHEGQKAAEEAMETQNHIEEIKKEASTSLKRERSRMLKEAQAEAEAQKASILEKANKQAELDLEKKKAAWAQEHQQLLANSKNEMIEAVISVAEKVIGDSLDTKSQTKLIDKELSSIIKAL